MFFKNAFFFTFTRTFTATQDELQAALSEHLFTPCGSTELSHFGFVPALGKGSESLAHEANGNILICVRKEEKILPPQVIKDMLDERVEALELEQDRRATKKEREQLKEDIIFELLPRAFSRIVDTHAYINQELNLIVINTGSRGKAEDLLALLRKALGTLPVTSFTPDCDISERMTNWVIDADRADGVLSKSFLLGEQASFKAPGDSSPEANVKNQDLSGGEVKAHLDADKYVTKLALEYDETMSFVLCDDLSIKRIKYFDVITGQNDDIDTDDKLARLDADFALMAGELNRMLADLLGEFDVKASDYLEQ